MIIPPASKRWFLVAIGCVCLAECALTKTIYVSFAGSHTTPFTNWTIAATNIIEAVASAADLDLVLVTNGEYTLTNRINVTADIVVSSVNGRAFTFINGNYPNTTNGCFQLGDSATKANTIIDGFTITNGFPKWSPHPDDTDGGGGIQSRRPAIIRNCTIRYNRSYNNNTWGGAGGGIWTLRGGIVSNCLITDNIAISNGGGGLYIYHRDTVPPLSWVSDCVISGNVAQGGNGNGGGVYLGSPCTVENTRIQSNSCNRYGGGVYMGAVSTILFNCTVAGNWNTSMVDGAGGGIAILNVAGVVTNCMVVSNTSCVQGGGIHNGNGANERGMVMNSRIGYNLSGRDGGGIYFTEEGNTSGKVFNCWIYNNTASNNGGGICLSGTSMVRNCSIYGNVSQTNSGGGVYAARGGIVQNSTIASNYVFSQGGGIFCRILSAGDPVALVENTILASNRGPGGVTNWSYTTGQATTPWFAYCCTDATNGMPGANNMAADPLFSDCNQQNYRLSAGSACINAGSNANWMLNARDLDGYPRLDRLNGRVDMGCYEHISRGTFISFR